MHRKLFIVIPILLLLSSILPCRVKAQQGKSSYHLRFFPDLWYNSVNGARIGVDVRGGQPGNVVLGQHRLNLGIWLATRFHKDPISYYLNFIEPVVPWSGFNAEASVAITSEYRTGFTKQGIQLSKRWQTGFDENQYELLRLEFEGEKLYSKRYELYPMTWDQVWHYMANIHFSIQTGSEPVISYFELDTHMSPGFSGKSFAQLEILFSQKLDLGKGMQWNYRLFGGFASSRTPNQYRFFYSMASPYEWKTNPLMRSRGTIPPVWMGEGWIQYAGGAGLRGYLGRDIYNLKTNWNYLKPSITSVNTEITFLNPISRAISKNNFLSNFLSLRSYVFADAGVTFSKSSILKSGLYGSGGPYSVSDVPDLLADAGPGLALSITFPDNEGQTKTITLRYDVPLWLSSPLPGMPAFKYRSIFGINAIIPFK